MKWWVILFYNDPKIAQRYDNFFLKLTNQVSMTSSTTLSSRIGAGYRIMWELSKFTKTRLSLPKIFKFCTISAGRIHALLALSGCKELKTSRNRRFSCGSQSSHLFKEFFTGSVTLKTFSVYKNMLIASEKWRPFLIFFQYCQMEVSLRTWLSYTRAILIFYTNVSFIVVVTAAITIDQASQNAVAARIVFLTIMLPDQCFVELQPV